LWFGTEKETLGTLNGGHYNQRYGRDDVSLLAGKGDGMSETLYKKVMKGKRVTYEVMPEQESATLNLTEPECLTAAGALGVTLLMIFERNIPAHKMVARKINAVQAAILDLYKGTGTAIDDDIAMLIFNAWDRTMKDLSKGDEA
jgi:hypothetical protein